MSESKWVVGQLAFQQRMPPLPAGKMTDAQRKAADEMIAGPRKGVKGPFVPLLRSPELMDRLQKVGEYLRFQSSLGQRISELNMLGVAGYFTTVSMILNVAHSPPQTDESVAPLVPYPL